MSGGPIWDAQDSRETLGTGGECEWSGRDFVTFGAALRVVRTMGNGRGMTSVVGGIC